MNPAALEISSFDAPLRELREGAGRWTALPPGERAALLVEVRERTPAVAAEWVERASAAKGISGTALVGEEWLSGPWALLYALNRYIATLESLARKRPIVDPQRVRARRDGRVVVDVFPNDIWDTLLLSGVRAEVWMAPEITPQTFASTVAPQYREPTGAPRVGLVLGAGNVASIAPLDMLDMLIAKNTACMLKLNPVNAYLGTIFERLFTPLVDRDFLRFAYGGSDAGALLCRHPGIDHIHITGADTTHDTIVFGDDVDRAKRKRDNHPIMSKSVSSELGNVSPVIVLPGPWSDADFAFQAENIVTQKLHNGGFNCVAAQVLMLPADWEGTPRLLGALSEVFARVGDRPAYYPGAFERREAAIAGRGAEQLIYVAADDVTDPLFQTEVFSSVLAYTTIAGDLVTYTQRAVAFANDALRGTLGATLILHPQTERRYADAVDTAIAQLRYGCIGVNAWTGVGFLISQVPWGAYPGNSRNDVGSGIGIVHNTNLFSRSQKSVVRVPFAPFPRSLFGYGTTLLPKPPWFVTNRNAAAVGAALCRFEAHKSAIAAAQVALLAMGG